MLATLTSLRFKRSKPNPNIRMPPMAMVAEIMGSVTAASRKLAPSVNVPCSTSTVPAKSRTPRPSTEAKMNAAMKLLTDDRQGTRAEEEARGDERLADRALPLEKRASRGYLQTPEPAFYTQKLAYDEARNRADRRHEGVVVLEDIPAL
jgi:hypothetical protein